MTTRSSTEEASEPPTLSWPEGRTANARTRKEADLGVLFVHGMGSAEQGETLRSHTEPLVDWLANGTEQLGRAELLDVALTPGDDEPAHFTCQLFESRDRGDDSDLRSTWILAESHWAQTFKAATYIRIAVWLIGSVPWMLGEYVRAAFRRERLRNTARLRWLRRVLIPFYALLGTIVAGPIVILLVLLVPTQYVPFKRFREWAEKLPRALSASLGDVYIILATHVDQEAIRSRIVRDHRWLTSRCEQTVIVAHSAGSAVTHQLICDGRIKDVQLYVTLGEAIWRMQWMRSLSQSGRRRIAALALAVIGFSLWVGAIVVAVNGHPWQTIGLLVAAGCVHAISVRIVWKSRDADEARRTAIEKLCGGEDPKVRLWRDYIGSSDPVPGGALTDTAHETQPDAQDAFSPQPADAGSYEPVWIRNRRSLLLDHTAYPDNLEEYVAGLGMDLFAASLLDKPPQTLIDADTAARAQIARALRTLSMSMARLGSAAVALAVLLALTVRDGTSLQRLGARVPLADELCAAVNKLLGSNTLKPELAGELVGVAIALITFAAAWLSVAAGWKAWDSKDRRLFMGREPPVGVTSTTPITDIPAKEARPRAIDAKFAAWWLVCLAAAGALVLDLADQTARWWLPLPALVMGALLILLVPPLARWRDRRYKAA